MSITRGLKVQKSVINALFLRELKARFTSSQAGLFWTFFQPFFTTAIFVGMHSIISGSHGQQSNDYAVYMAVNLIPFFFFRDLLTKSAGAFKANKGLFIYKQVKPIDTIIARVLVEGFITLIVILAFLTIFYMLNIDINPKDLTVTIIGILWLIFFGFGLGILIAVGNLFYDFVGKIIGVISLPLMLLSAVFFSIQSIYQKSPIVAKLLLYNPVAHFMELIHGSFFYDLDTRFVNYEYMAIWTFAPFAIGIWLYISLEEKIISK